MEELLGDPDHDVVGAVALLTFGFEHVAGGEKKDQAEQVEHPGEPVDESGAEEDEPGPGDQGKHDSEQQHLLLVGSRHGEAAHDDEEDEQVVN